MDMNLKITDMSGAYIEHSTVITNFVANVYPQIKDSVCRVYGDNVQYKWVVNGEDKKLIPDATINCRVHQRKGNSFFDTPRFVMEVLSPSTEKYDRTEKMEMYRQQEVEEYWIVDPVIKNQILVYDFANGDMTQYTLQDSVKVGIYDDLIIDFGSMDI